MTSTRCRGHEGRRIGLARTVRRRAPVVVATTGAVLASASLRAQLGWLPMGYLPAVAGVVAVTCRLLWWRGGRRRQRWPALAACAVALAGLTPVPWLLAPLEQPPGTVWALDGRLIIDGHAIDPPGRWYWLTAGRPPIGFELAWSRLRGGPPARNLLAGRDDRQPRHVEPRAVAIGLSLSTEPGQPGQPVQPTEAHDAYLGGWLARSLPGQWFRGLSVGRSHGLIVALAAYAGQSATDLAQGRSIAGTGAVGAEGTVERIGELWAKASAARDAGIDLLLFPAVQARDLAGFDPGDMRLVPVTTVAEAIDALAAPVGAEATATH